MATGQRSKTNDPLEQVPPTWLALTNSVKFAFVPGRDRSLDQFSRFSDLVHQIVQSESFGLELKDRLGQLAAEDFAKRGHSGNQMLNVAIETMLEEWRAGTRAGELANSATRGMDTTKRTWRRWVRPVLEKASIITGSVKDVAEVSPYLKFGLTSYGELIDMFKKN